MQAGHPKLNQTPAKESASKYEASCDKWAAASQCTFAKVRLALLELHVPASQATLSARASSAVGPSSPLVVRTQRSHPVTTAPTITSAPRKLPRSRWTRRPVAAAASAAAAGLASMIFTPRRLPRSRRTRTPPLSQAATIPLSELRIPHAHVGFPLCEHTKAISAQWLRRRPPRTGVWHVGAPNWGFSAFGGHSTRAHPLKEASCRRCLSGNSGTGFDGVAESRT